MDQVTARLAGAVVMNRGAYDDRAVATALRGAEVVCATGRADVALLNALRQCTGWLDSVGDEEWRVLELRNRVRRAVVAATPPDLLDLSLVGSGDAWADPARALARDLPPQDIAPLVRRLGELGPRKPSPAWLAAVEQDLIPAAAQRLLHGWIELAAHTDIVPDDPDGELGHSPGTLFVAGNQDIVRATVLAARLVLDAPRLPDLLGALARRGAAHNGVAGMPEALALKVARSAVDTLSVRNTPADRAVLEQLLEDLQRRDLLKQVRTALERA